MPLCSLEIPRQQFEALPVKDRSEAAIAVCEDTLNKTLGGLGIPDPEDREWRINVSDQISEPRISLGFTLGTDEYGTGSIFDPSRETIQETGKVVYEAASNSPISVRRVIMEPWRNTTFLIRSDKETGDMVSPSPAILEKTGREVGRPVVTIAISPEKNEEMAVSKKPEVEKVTDYIQILSYGIVKTPGLLINSKVAVQGQVPTVEQLQEILAKHTN